MSQKSSDKKLGYGPVYRTERDPATLLRHLTAVSALADSEKEALGFLPEQAYREAIEKRRLVAMFRSKDGSSEMVGFALFSGVFPNARIQQVVVARDHRRKGIASALINGVISQLEARGYLTISAAVASDLSVAQSFYERSGFIARRSVSGGQARKRAIILRARDLETVSLLSMLEGSGSVAESALDLGLRTRGASPAPLYVIDLNVLFDVTKGKGRTRSPAAGQLVAAALAHKIRLAIAPEFVVELERQNRDDEVDPVLRLARQLPRLTSIDGEETDRLAALIHKIVFVASKTREASSPQALSDARHLAQAAVARASCYVTSDGRILAARDELLGQVGIDVASLDEFCELLPGEPAFLDEAQLKGTNCTTRQAPVETVRKYLEAQGVSETVLDEFIPDSAHLLHWKGRIISEAGEVVAAGGSVAPTSIDGSTRLLVHVRPDHLLCQTFAEHLLDVQCQEACHTGPAVLELSRIPGQSTVRRAAVLKGFLSVPRGDALIKVALGRPVTNESWPAVARQTRRRTGLRLPETPPDATSVQSGFVVEGPDGSSVTVRLPALEEALGPTILIWPGREGAIVPIERNYADDLLGTSNQLALFGRPEAAFVTRRTYFNSPRTASVMRPGMPILFYESKRSGGRGAIVAVARIVDTVVMEKRQVPDNLLRRAVVEDLEPLSTSTEVLATSFDNLLRFSVPVSFDALRALGAIGSANLQTTTAVTNAMLGAILELGWSRA